MISPVFFFFLILVTLSTLFIVMLHKFKFNFIETVKGVLEYFVTEDKLSLMIS